MCYLYLSEIKIAQSTRSAFKGYAMTPGLKRIITVNSKPHGHLLSEFDFNGATRVTGSNGAGKTSLLKLIPFFFGADRKSIIGGAERVK
ncbi:ATP-binding protein [Vibrio rarus]|uniref:ATP-binding protein n=2 Tax=Vibrio rarus TaxID=413403 RepID=UPI0039ED5D97